MGLGTVVHERPAGYTFLRYMKDIPNDGIIRFPGWFHGDWLLLTTPQALAEVLVHKSYDYQKSDRIRSFLRIILGNGLIVVEGNEHKFQRKHLAPAFSFGNIKKLYPLFWMKAVELARCVVAEINENPEHLNDDEKHPRSVVEVKHWANMATIDIIGVAGLGRHFNALTTADDELTQIYGEILEPSTEKGIFFAANILLPRWLVTMLPWKLNKMLKDATTRLREVCLQFVRDKKNLIKLQKEEHIDILSLLIRSENFGDDMLVDQLLTFLAAG